MNKGGTAFKRPFYKDVFYFKEEINDEKNVKWD